MYTTPNRTIAASIHFQGDGQPDVEMSGLNPATSWLELLHLPLGFLARVMFTMPHGDFYGSQYLLDALQNLESPLELRSLEMELSLGLGMKHPEWIDRPVSLKVRQSQRTDNHYFAVEAILPEDCPGAQLAQAVVVVALRAYQQLSPAYGMVLLDGLRRMARAYASGEVNPYDWKSLVTFPQMVLEEAIAKLARQSAILA